MLGLFDVLPFGSSILMDSPGVKYQYLGIDVWGRWWLRMVIRKGWDAIRVCNTCECGLAIVLVGGQDGFRTMRTRRRA